MDHLFPSAETMPISQLKRASVSPALLHTVCRGRRSDQGMNISQRASFNKVFTGGEFLPGGRLVLTLSKNIERVVPSGHDYHRQLELWDSTVPNAWDRLASRTVTSTINPLDEVLLANPCDSQKSYTLARAST